jgi:glycosyltransferase involved in cell wall biosynthesis
MLASDAGQPSVAAARNSHNRESETSGNGGMRINQWLAAAHPNDAIGDHARRVQSLLRGMGHESDLYSLTIDTELQGLVRPFDDPWARRGDVTILHYHNITPAHYFAPYSAGQFRLSRVGREHLARLAEGVDLALGVSEYNRRELESLGFHETGVMPIAIDTGRITRAPRRPALERLLDDGLPNFLFVGRIAPNKRIDDYIRLAEHYKRYVSIDYRFIFVGRDDAVPGYHAAVRQMIVQYDMPPDRFVFTGPVPDVDLATYYRMADVYVSLSEHEGFCVPLLEAMAAGVPVLAYAAAAVPDTLGGAGVQFSPRDLEHAAELLGVLVYDEGVRRDVIAGQHRRLQDFGDERVVHDLEALIARVTSKAG